MLRNLKDLQHFSIKAKDGDLGSVEEFYFDDEKWVVRYMVANTGNWLSGRLVLISPISVHRIDWKKKQIQLMLTQQQIKEAPDIDLRKPVSRQQEERYYTHYAWPVYWRGAGIWGVSMHATALAKSEANKQPEEIEENDRQDGRYDRHLRSSKEVIGYHIQAKDDEIGHLEDFLVEDETWAIRYFIVDTRNWLPGKKVMLSVRWIERVHWGSAKVHVKLPKKKIETAPECDPEGLVEKQFETELHDHYEQPRYW
jgi:hypothetical protein